jgi:hypothetical protein
VASAAVVASRPVEELDDHGVGRLDVLIDHRRHAFVGVEGAHDPANGSRR